MSETKTNAAAVQEFLRKIGRRGGQARARSLTAKQRTNIARKGAKARWSQTASPGTQATA